MSDLTYTYNSAVEYIPGSKVLYQGKYYITKRTVKGLPPVQDIDSVTQKYIDNLAEAGELVEGQKYFITDTNVTVKAVSVSRYEPSQNPDDYWELLVNFYTVLQESSPKFLFEDLPNYKIEGIEEMYMVFGDYLDKLYLKVKKLNNQLTIDENEGQYLYELAYLLGLEYIVQLSKYLNEDGTVNTDINNGGIEQRTYDETVKNLKMRLKTAVAFYLSKGTHRAFQNVFQGYNAQIKIIELWQKYSDDVFDVEDHATVGNSVSGSWEVSGNYWDASYVSPWPPYSTSAGHYLPVIHYPPSASGIQYALSGAPFDAYVFKGEEGLNQDILDNSLYTRYAKDILFNYGADIYKQEFFDLANELSNITALTLWDLTTFTLTNTSSASATVTATTYNVSGSPENGNWVGHYHTYPSVSASSFEFETELIMPSASIVSGGNIQTWVIFASNDTGDTTEAIGFYIDHTYTGSVLYVYYYDAVYNMYQLGTTINQNTRYYINFKYAYDEGTDGVIYLTLYDFYNRTSPLWTGSVDIPIYGRPTPIAYQSIWVGAWDNDSFIDITFTNEKRTSTPETIIRYETSPKNNYFILNATGGNLLFKTSDEPRDSSYEPFTWYRKGGDIYDFVLSDDYIFILTGENLDDNGNARYTMNIYNNSLDLATSADEYISESLPNVYFVQPFDWVDRLILDRGKFVEIRRFGDFELINTLEKQDINRVVKFAVQKNNDDCLVVFDDGTSSIITGLNSNPTAIMDSVSGDVTRVYDLFDTLPFQVYYKSYNNITAVENISGASYKRLISFLDSYDVATNYSDIISLTSEVLSDATYFEKIIWLLENNTLSIYDIKKNTWMYQEVPVVSGGGYSYTDLFFADKINIYDNSDITLTLNKILAFNTGTSTLYKTHYFDAKVLRRFETVQLLKTSDDIINMINNLKPLHTKLRYLTLLDDLGVFGYGTYGLGNFGVGEYGTTQKDIDDFMNS